MSRVFKSKDNVITQKFKKGIHDGIDLVGSGYTLDSIVAHSDGTVANVRSNYVTTDKTGSSYGNFVLIKHNNGMYTLYAHLKYNSITVKTGNKVSKGQIVGYMGNTGHSLGAHLHFEVRDKNENKVDPTSYINADLPFSNSKKYEIGRYIVNTDILTVRKDPFISKNDDNWIKYSQLTKNAQEQVKKLDKTKPNGLVRGVVCDVSEVKGDFGKIPSGWICLDYCKKQ